MIARRAGWLAFGVVAGGLVAARPAMAQRGKPCLVVLLNADRRGFGSQPLPGNTNYDVGGNVRMQCKGQPIYMNADSVSVISGDLFRFITHADYRDPSYHITADTLFYTRRLEKVEARGHVHMLDRLTGSILDAPYVDYYRAVKGINDSASMIALQRATVHYFKRAMPADTAVPTPYVLIGDALRGFGSSRLRGNGAVSIDKDSLRGTGDSLWFDQGKPGVGRLMGKRATLWRHGPDSFAVHGREIRIGIDENQLHDLHAFDSASVSRGGSLVAGDSIALTFVDQKLALTLAWSRSRQSSLHDAGYDIFADSLAVETPGELLREVRAFGSARMVSPRDSMQRLSTVATTPDSIAPDTTHNTLWGGRIVAHFTQADSSGKPVTRLQQLVASGQAASYFSRVVTKQGKVTPSINYTRADTILVHMQPGDSVAVASVQAFGHVDGVQLETATLHRKTGDTTHAVLPGGHR